MNGPEKKVVYLAFCLFVLGVVVRVIPWGLPSIDHFQVGGELIVPAENRSNVEYGGRIQAEAGLQDRAGNFEGLPAPPDSLNKLMETAGGEWGEQDLSPKKKEKKPKKAKKVVKLPLHVNSASAEELCALNGVGPKLADKIVAYRESNGAFKSPSDLQKVPGIGKKKLESILPGVIFD